MLSKMFIKIGLIKSLVFEVGPFLFFFRVLWPFYDETRTLFLPNFEQTFLRVFIICA